MSSNEALFLRLRDEAARIADAGTRQLYLNALVEVIRRQSAGLRPSAPKIGAARTPRAPLWDDDPGCTYDIAVIGRGDAKGSHGRGGA